MAVTVKDLLVRASSGENVTPQRIPAALAHFCEILESVSPTTMLRSANRDHDLAQIHTATQLKTVQVDASSFGITSTWTPEKYHEVDPTNGSVWLTNANTRAIVYKVTTAGGTDLYVNVVCAP